MRSRRLSTPLGLLLTLAGSPAAAQERLDAAWAGVPQWGLRDCHRLLEAHRTEPGGPGSLRRYAVALAGAHAAYLGRTWQVLDGPEGGAVVEAVARRCLANPSALIASAVMATVREEAEPVVRIAMPPPPSTLPLGHGHGHGATGR